MADNSSGGTGLLGVIIGAALVIGVAFFFFGGFGNAPKSGNTSITVTTPSAPAAPAAPKQ